MHGYGHQKALALKEVTKPGLEPVVGPGSWRRVQQFRMELSCLKYMSNITFTH